MKSRIHHLYEKTAMLLCFQSFFNRKLHVVCTGGGRIVKGVSGVCEENAEGGRLAGDNWKGEREKENTAVENGERWRKRRCSLSLSLD